MREAESKGRIMSKTFEETVKGGRLTFQACGRQAHVVSGRVLEPYLEIPDEIHGLVVTGIEKKAMLGSRALREAALPAQLCEIGDWAFASCRQLEKVWIPRRQIRFGRGVFKGCGNLLQIPFREEENQALSEKVSGLLAMAPVMLEAEYLLSPMEAGEEVWLEKLDARLEILLDRPDAEGYSRQVLCGEEDLMASLDLYLEERRRQKARLCYRRLLNDYGLGKGLSERVEVFLRESTKGCAYQAAWEVAFREHGSRRAYYEVFARAGCITEENFPQLLADMGERYPEMKAWLMRYREEKMRRADFFAGLSLD